jgi:drug/metabolite transporter (DMT)-like permease
MDLVRSLVAGDQRHCDDGDDPAVYLGLARGPVSVVAPIVASHPVLVVAVAVMFGARPTTLQWLAMTATMGGVVVVASTATHSAKPGSASRRELVGTIAIAVASAVAYAALILAGQAAVPTYGEFNTLWLGRLVSLATLLLLFLLRQERPRLPRSWWPILAAQGGLDAAGYLFLFAGSHGADASIAAVTGSTFGAVTTLLARIVLHEPISLAQWSGIVMIFAGVAVLSGTA